MENNLEVIPIFFAVDDGYIPLLAVALQSLIDNSSDKYYYCIKVLYTNIKEENKKKILKYEKSNVKIEFVDLNYYIQKVKDKLYTRDYYTKTTYFRLFMPDLYPQYNKAIYLDSDIVVLGDIAELYHQQIGNNLIAAIPDDSVQNIPEFQVYVEKVVGLSDYRNYFNAGILLMNLDELRKFKFQEKFLYLLETVKFAVAQDQDYLNRLCKGRVKIVNNAWNRMPLPDNKNVMKEEDIKLIHYNLIFKPWHFDNIIYKDYFWKYAKKTQYYDDLVKMKEAYTEDERFRDMEQLKNLKLLCQKEADCVGDDRLNKDNYEENERRSLLRIIFRSDKKETEEVQEKERKSIFKGILKNEKKNENLDVEEEQNNEKYQERLEVIKRIEEMEKRGLFDIDAEEDPPSIPLTVDNVDYLNKKSTSKIKNRLANRVGAYFLDNLLEDQKLIIKDVLGIENLQSVNTGAMLTCNHFNPFDSFAIEEVFRRSGQSKNKKLYKVIREGNYTNFPGLYGFFFRNCDTLPLSSSNETMEEFIKAVETILKRKDFILIYPEQSMWWNYRKPKPLKNGGFKLAARNKVPIIPIFITMEDSNIMGEDGFPVQEYIIHIEKPIYPDEKLSVKENTIQMRDKNAAVWKKVYEDFYKVPLEYNTDKKVEA